MGTDSPDSAALRGDAPRAAPAASGAAAGVRAAAPLLRAEEIWKSFGPKSVLKGVSVSVAKGEVVSILGPNGCGKSTLLRCINLLERYERGRVLLDGQEVSRGAPDGRHLTKQEQAAAQALRRRVGMVFQRFNLFPHMSVLENVMCGPRRVLGLPCGEAQRTAEQVLRKVGLWEKHPCDPATLSGGQQQRAAIARALAMSPEMMLFDEATSALDPVMTKEVLRVIRDLSDEGMTMLIVTHNLDFARDISDRVLFMEDGLIGAEGTPECIFGRQPTPGLRAFLQRG